MVININPNRINATSGADSKVAARKRRQAEAGGASYAPPRRADVNYVPAPESLRTLVRSAVEALKRGIAWDRGTIVNLLV